MNSPLKDILVIDFSQFLAGPVASLRLSDLGARVIKIERPESGDLCRHLYVSEVVMNGDSSVFHAINRNKESFSANLKLDQDHREVEELVKKADVLLHNFRPGVMDRLGFDYKSVKEINPTIVYGEISGFGKKGPWKDKPGQDLLVQALSGLTWLSGKANTGPTPMGLSIIDYLTGAQLAQGILSCLVRKGVSGEGGLVQVSLMEAAIDFQFETITTFYQDGGQPTKRSEIAAAHAYLAAPYGIYETKNGYLALAMGAIPQLGELLGCDELLKYKDSSKWFEKRDEIKKVIANYLVNNTTEHWLDILEPADIWCAKVYNWKELRGHKGFKTLNMVQKVFMKDGYNYKTTRCPIRIDGEIITSPKGAPKIGEDNEEILKEIVINNN